MFQWIYGSFKAYYVFMNVEYGGQLVAYNPPAVIDAPLVLDGDLHKAGWVLKYDPNTFFYR